MTAKCQLQNQMLKKYVAERGGFRMAMDTPDIQLATLGGTPKFNAKPMLIDIDFTSFYFI